MQFSGAANIAVIARSEELAAEKDSSNEALQTYLIKILLSFYLIIERERERERKCVDEHEAISTKTSENDWSLKNT